MTTYVSDTFTAANGTAIASHTPDIGGAWTSPEGGFVIQSNQLTEPDFTTCHCVNAATIPDDASISANITLDISGVGAQGGVCGRINATGGPFEWYDAIWSDGDQEWQIRKFASFGTTTLASLSDTSYTSGTKKITLSMSGSSLSLLVDDVLKVSTSDSTYTSGPCGIRYESHPGGGIVFDAFIAEDASSSPPGEHTVTGAGSFALGTPSWISVAVSDIPIIAREGVMDPLNYFHLGLVAFGTDNGEMRAQVVEFALSLFPIPTGMTTLWYWFPSGATAVVTELSSP